MLAYEGERIGALQPSGSDRDDRGQQLSAVTLGLYREPIIHGVAVLGALFP
jgi:hypothetical protein